MNKIMNLILILLLLCLMMIIGCWPSADETDAETSDGTETDEPVTRDPELFAPEYDYVEGYDISDSFDDVARAFDKCTTNFSPYWGDEIEYDSSEAYVSGLQDMLEFVASHADCTCGDDDLCENLDYDLYIAGIARNTTEEAFGYAINRGLEGRAICFICVEWIAEFQRYPAIKDKYELKTLIRGTVAHELGHGRANLTDGCIGSSWAFFDTARHSDISCIMGAPYDDYLNILCADTVWDDSPFESFVENYYCNICSHKLAQVRWND